MESTSKVAFQTLKSATVKTNNSVDETRVYDIEADVQIMDKTTGSFNNGIVKSNDTVLATFNHYGVNNLNINYQGVDAEGQCAICTAVNAFVGNVREYVQTNPLVI